MQEAEAAHIPLPLSKASTLSSTPTASTPTSTSTTKLANILAKAANPLTPTLQTSLDFDKIKLRIANEAYLRTHPEINDIISYFISSTLQAHPTDIPLYATKLLSDGNLR
jgi:hypothetical protein